MSNTTTQREGGIGFLGALFLLFLGLKLGGVIGWSWWWVTAPLWLPVATVGAAVLGLLGFVLLFKRK